MELELMESAYLGRVIRREMKKASRNGLFYMRHEIIRQIPGAVFMILNITELNVTDCRLEELSPEVGKLHALRRLNLQHNNLTTLPNEISELTELVAMNVSHNKITKLPDSFSSLLKLRYVDLTNNKIEKLPPSMLDIIIEFAKNSYGETFPIYTVFNPVDTKIFPKGRSAENNRREFRPDYSIDYISNYLVEDRRKCFMVNYFAIALGCNPAVLDAIYYNIPHWGHHCFVYKSHPAYNYRTIDDLCIVCRNTDIEPQSCCGISPLGITVITITGSGFIALAILLLVHWG